MEIRKLAPGDRVLDYRVLERLGEGGFGEVFRAEHEVLERIVALKVPRDQSALTALRHEGVVQASLDHPNIVKTIELSISHDPPYVVMEFADGPSLAALLKKKGGLPWRRAAKILLATAEALAFAHTRGVVHGDVKPGNVLIERGKQGRILLTDFGLGRVFESASGNLQISRSLELASTGAEVQGTIRYIAPELLRGEAPDERCDMYSYGVLLFEIVTGRLPEGREVPSDLVKDLPGVFDRIFERMFARRERRPKSLTETISDLRGLLDPKGAAAPKAEVVKAIPVSTAALPKSALRHSRHTVATPAPVPALAAALPLAAQARSPAFSRWREKVLAEVGEQLGEVRGLTTSDGRGFDGCYGVNVEGEPHHRIYVLLLPEVDAAKARSAVAEARRIFDQEKGIWEKEVTFWVIALKVKEHEQVMWTLKSFSMGWWRRRRIVLQDAGTERLYATELGCDPRGNPLKRAFLTASEKSLRQVALPAEPGPQLVAMGPRCGRRLVRGTAWSAALALVMTFGLLACIMAVELANRRVRLHKGSSAVPTAQDGAISDRVPDQFTPEEAPPPRYY